MTPGLLTKKDDGSFEYKIINEWQLCPKCNGEGYRTPIPGGYEEAELRLKGLKNAICDLCNGKKIISKVNGLPPLEP